MRHLRRDHTFGITDPTGNEMAEEEDVGITDMMIGDPSIPPVVI